MLPWKRLEKKTNHTFIELKTFFISHVAKCRDDIYKTIHQDKRSNQIKHNRLETRILELEQCFSKELTEFRKELHEKEIEAAEEVEKNVK